MYLLWNRTQMIMSLDLTEFKAAMVQVMAWCHPATSHYLDQCWFRSMLSCGVTRPQWVKPWSLSCWIHFSIFNMIFHTVVTITQALHVPKSEFVHVHSTTHKRHPIICPHRRAAILWGVLRKLIMALHCIFWLTFNNYWHLTIKTTWVLWAHGLMQILAENIRFFGSAHTLVKSIVQRACKPIMLNSLASEEIILQVYFSNSF